MASPHDHSPPHAHRRGHEGINAIARKRWATAIMANPEKNAMLAVQTLRNYIMASTVLATTAITLASLISVFMGTSSPLTAASMLIYGNKTHLLSSIKYFAISLCFISAFVCNVQAIRYYAHTSMLLGISSLQNSLIHEEKKEEKEKEAHRTNEFVEYVTNGLNQGSRFWSFGLRAFYASFTLFLWMFGPIPMVAFSVTLCFCLYFLDTTTEHSRVLHGPRDLDKALGEIVLSLSN
ncbi:hypothetical protein LUZ62_079099 [Rhynchospora pubera]|uniref:Uncharacterized protein n=1 Tax=Rhynchospora pubera TaxID=906938 RepID=A0AAV8DLA3_9POAL|nr:hypothetical protein LUZ62_079099 [Rhynchospora pubera]